MRNIGLWLCLLLITACSSKHREFGKVSCDAQEACETLTEVYEDRKQCVHEKRRSSRRTFRQYRLSRSVECAQADYDYRLCFAEELPEDCDAPDEAKERCGDLYEDFLDLCE